VKLLGIDSVMCPAGKRQDVWRRLAGDLKPPRLGAIATAIGLDDLPDAFATLLKGGARGRFVVTL
jgi:acrylyl-CoA reductase (NADPH)